MARTKTKSGRKPVFEGKGRQFHFNLPAEVRPGEKMSVADAFEKVALTHGTVTALALKTVLDIPEVQRLLREGE
jgi:hypothetical protein